VATDTTKTPAKATEAKSDSKTAGSVSATVFVPAGPVPRDSIFKTAVSAVRNAIPVVYTLTPEIDKVSGVKTVDGVKGREYTIKVNYDTELPGAEPVNVDAEIEKLTVPSLSDFAVATQVHELPPAPDDPK
jgi:hypothetical protein